ncbi:MAG: pyruvate kinase [Oscillospiraceae bacterium]|nr:pyruvate kinase [Oscillospiraceae bacterium]
MVKLYATLGPACAQTETLARMLDAGMNGVRLNLSHMTLQEAEPWLEALAQAGQSRGVSPELLIDLQGPELRIGRLRQAVELTEGASVSLDFIPPELREHIARGQELLLDDGKLLLCAQDQNRALVLRGGVLHSRKSIALPGLSIHLPTLTRDDRKALAQAVGCGVTGVMQPFVRSRGDLEQLRRVLDENGGESIRIFAKIENREGVDQLPELLDAADEMIVARGDLGNAVPLWELPGVQKRIAACCREHHKPFMVVTQMLASMEHSPIPTRAEMSDIFNAVLDGVSSVMLTNETAAGDYPVEAVAFMRRCVEAASVYRNNIM